MTKLLIDVDGVLAPIHERILEQVNEMQGTGYTIDDWTSWTLTDCFPKPIAMWINKIGFESAELYEQISPIPKAKAAMGAVRYYFDYNIVSTPRIGHASAKLAWLDNHGFDVGKVVLTAEKSVVKGDLLIDDGPHNLRSFPADSLRFDRPWNQSCEYEGASDWFEVLEILKQRGYL